MRFNIFKKNKSLEPYSPITLEQMMEELKNMPKWKKTYYAIRRKVMGIGDIPHEIKKFFRNLRIYWDVIRHDDWYDHSYFTTLLEIKIRTMKEGWPNAHYVGSEEELQTLTYLHQLILKIQDEDLDSENQKNVELFFDTLKEKYLKLWD